MTVPLAASCWLRIGGIGDPPDKTRAPSLRGMDPRLRPNANDPFEPAMRRGRPVTAAPGCGVDG